MQNPNIHILDASPDAFKHFIHFIYTDSVAESVNASLTHQLRLISRKYCFTELQNLTEAMIKRKLTAANAGTLCSEAYHNQDFELVSTCLQVIAGSLSKTPASEIAKLPLECMKLLVHADETSAGEPTVFRACVAWAQSRSQDVKSEMQCLLPLIRFQNMSPEQFAKDVVPSGLMPPEHVLEILCAGVCGKYVRNPRRSISSVFIVGDYGGTKGLRTAFELDLSPMAWNPLPELSQKRSETRACVCRGVLYCVGGFDDGVMDSTETLDLSTRSSWTTVSRMCVGRRRHDVCSLQGKVYAIGGVDPDNNCLASVEVFDPGTNQWTAVSPMNSRRFICSATVLDGKIYVTGGYNGSRLSSAECYDPASDTWSAIPPMLSVRSSHSACAFGGKLFVFGGFGPFKSASAECYDPSTGQWTQLAPMPAIRERFGCAVIGDSIIVCGGRVDYEESDTCDRYFPSSNTWERSSLRLPYCMFDFGMCGGPSW